LTRYFFVEPLDLIAFRGNRLFGDEGTVGDTTLLPQPSVFAGAFRSLLVSKLNDEQRSQFFDGDTPEGDIGQELGSLQNPGTFKIEWLSFGEKDVTGEISALISRPNDVVALNKEENKEDPKAILSTRLKLGKIPRDYCRTSGEFDHILYSTSLTKTSGQDFFLRMPEFRKYLNGDDTFSSVPSEQCYSICSRIGIGLDPKTKSAEQGKLYTSNYLALKKGFGYLVGISGSSCINNSGFIRLGADGKSARYEESTTIHFHDFNYETILDQKLFKIIMLTAGIFKNGAIPDMFILQNGRYVLVFEDLQAVLTTMSITNHDTVSGWDMFNNKPKPAVKTVGAGSVYYLCLEHGSRDSLVKLNEALAKGRLMEFDESRHRLTEGFSRALLGVVRTANELSRKGD
jgi:CRISPR-associated protein Cmr3